MTNTTKQMLNNDLIKSIQLNAEREKCFLNLCLAVDKEYSFDGNIGHENWPGIMGGILPEIAMHADTYNDWSMIKMSLDDKMQAIKLEYPLDKDSCYPHYNEALHDAYVFKYKQHPILSDLKEILLRFHKIIWERIDNSDKIVGDLGKHFGVAISPVSTPGMSAAVAYEIAAFISFLMEDVKYESEIDESLLEKIIGFSGEVIKNKLPANQ